MQRSIPVSTCCHLLTSTVRGFAAFVRGLAFWTAVLLPVLYLPPLLAGPATVAELSVLGQLIALHVAAIVVGHDYRGVAGELGDRPR